MALTAGLVAWAVVSDGGGSAATAGKPRSGPEPAAAPQNSERASPRPTPTVTVTVTASPKSTVTVTATPKQLGKPCRKVGARLAVRARKNAYGPGAEPELTIRVKPRKRCLLDPDKLHLVITSGTDRIWSSQDCSGKDRWPRRITPRRPYTEAATWQRVRSNPAKCGEETSSAKAGWYAATAKLGDKESEEAVFRLE